MSEYYCVDRFKGEYAVIEGPDEKMVDIKISELPVGLKEGDCLKKVEGKWIIDEEEKNRRIERIKDLLSNIKKD